MSMDIEEAIRIAKKYKRTGGHKLTIVEKMRLATACLTPPQLRVAMRLLNDEMRGMYGVTDISSDKVPSGLCFVCIGGIVFPTEYLVNQYNCCVEHDDSVGKKFSFERMRYED